MAASDTPRPARYSRVAIGIHWLSAILIIVLLMQGLFMTKLDDDEFKTNLYRLHVTFGYFVLILTLIRLFWVWRDERPAALPMPSTERLFYRGIHVLLYAGAFITALSGVLLVAGSGITPIATEVTASGIDRELPIRNAHWLFATGMLVLLVGHVGGVLVYHWRKGGVLSRMGIGRDPSAS
jgi:cytochrome b561